MVEKNNEKKQSVAKIEKTRLPTNMSKPNPFLTSNEKSE